MQWLGGVRQADITQYNIDQGQYFHFASLGHDQLDMILIYINYTSYLYI